jgi:tetratricopeptide (TPR) repeat protein
MLRLSRKSQIAIEYSYRYHITHPEAHVFWVHSSNPDRFLADYEDIARHFGLLHADASAAETIRLVRERLGNDSNMQWLMVVDNADDEDAFFGIGVDTPPHPVQTLGIIRYLPTSSNGSTILTTRNKRVGQRFSARHLIQIPLLTTQDGLELLRHKLDDYVDWDDTQGRDLLELLDHLPLAITQASAYANEEGVSIKHYLAILRDCFSEKLVLKENYYDSRRDSHTPNAVFLTWRVSFNQILVQRPRAAEILSLIAFLDRQCITISLLRHKDEDQIVFDQSVGTLKAYSFVTEDKSRGTFGIHRLLQKCARMWVESQGKAIQWQESAIDAVHMACPSSVAFDKWPLWDNILAHAELVLQYDIGIGPCSLHRSSIFTRVARYHRKRGRFDLSRERAMAAMSNLRDAPQNSQSHILEATEALVQALKSLGDLKSAEEQCCALRRMSEDLLGKTHPDTLLALNLLARILAAQGKYREAEKFSVLIFMRAMKTYGPDHPETLAAMNDLGVTSRKRKKYKDAERRFRSCLKSRKAVLGPDHPDTLASMNNLGAVLSDQMKYKESEEVMEEAFRFSLNALGEHHDHTLSSRHNLGRLYFQWGKYKKAQGMLGPALAVRQKNLGWDHPTTVATEALLDLVLEQLRLSDQEPK